MVCVCIERRIHGVLCRGGWGGFMVCVFIK